MKNLGLLAAGIFLTATAFAQTTSPTTNRTPAEKAQMKDLRQDVRAYDKDKAQAKADINKGNLAAAKADITAAKTQRKDIAADAATLKAEGINKPVKIADEKAVRTDAKALHTDKADLRADVKKGDLADAKTDLANIKAERKSLKADARQARRDGIKHPVRRAK